MERINLDKATLVESILLNQVVDEEQHIVFSEWNIFVTYKDSSRSIF